MSLAETLVSERISEFNIDPVFTRRWSPRAFSGETIDDATLYSLFEAARWAPSANNSQPWRFIYARRGSPVWPQWLAVLNDNNQRWAANSSVLIVLVSKQTQVRKGATEATPLRSHALDAGAAWAHLALQAVSAGWHTHAIGGFDKDRARELLGIPEDYHVNIAIAVGRQAERSSLPPDLQLREQPSQRHPLSQLVAEGRFAFD